MKVGAMDGSKASKWVVCLVELLVFCWVEQLVDEKARLLADELDVLWVASTVEQKVASSVGDLGDHADMMMVVKTVVTMAVKMVAMTAATMAATMAVKLVGKLVVSMVGWTVD